MVKLSFTPGKNIVKSKTTKINLNPFKDVENEIQSTHTKCNINIKLIGLENFEYVLKNWYKVNQDKIFLVIGPTGCGKTTMVEQFCTESDISLYSVINSTKSKKDLLRELISFMDSSFFDKLTKPKKLILIDEYQNGPNDLLSINDIISIKNKSKDIFSGIYDSNKLESLNIPPIVVISADSKGSKLSDLKKVCDVYYISEIPKNILRTWIKEINPNLDNSIIEILLKKCKSDKRLLLNVLQFISSSKDTKGITLFLESFYKDEDVNLFEFTNALFDNQEPLDVNEIYKVYETDGYIIANLVHENYLDFSDSIEDIANTADAISYGDTVYTDIYDSTKIFFPEVHCFHALCLPSYYSRSDIKNNKCQLRSSVINNRYNIYLNNKKIIDKIMDITGFISIYDIMVFKKFINQSLVKSKQLTKNQNDYLDINEFLQVMLTLFSESFERLSKLVFNIYDFDL